MGYKDIDIIFKLEEVNFELKGQIDGNHPANLRYDESVTCKTIQNCEKPSGRKKSSRNKKFSRNRDPDHRWSLIRVNS
jgi:hypothetical protein